MNGFSTTVQNHPLFHELAFFIFASFSEITLWYKDFTEYGRYNKTAI
jgi:hypothetical protein